MSFQEFIKQESTQGEFDSEGSFTLDLSKAAGKLSKNNLPSESHFLLKLVQLANQLGAKLIEIRLRASGKLVEFQVPEGEFQITDAHQVAKSLSTGLASGDIGMEALISALLGSLHPSHESTSLRIRQGQREQRLSIGRGRRVQISSNQGEVVPNASANLRFSVSNRSSWKFWQVAPKLQAAVSLVEEYCAFSASRIKLNGSILEAPPVSELNEHLTEIGGSNFSAIDGAFRLGQNRVSASNIMFELAEGSDQAFSLTPPESSAYATVSEVFNLWEPGMREDNDLRPDGQEAPAWMLQLKRLGQNISMTDCPKSRLYKTVLVMNLHGAGNNDALRLKVIQHGVLVLNLLDEKLDQRWDIFRGCTLMIVDDELETDLTGLRVIRNRQLIEKVLSYEAALLESQDYFAQGESMMTFV